MRIRTFGTEAVVVDQIDSIGEIGELTKLAVKLGYESHVHNAQDEDVRGLQVTLTRERDWKTWGEDELVNWAVLYAFVKGLSGDRVVEIVRAGLRGRHFPMDKPIQDVMEVGSGPDHEGHGHG